MRALLVAMALQDVDEGKLDDARLVFDVHTWLWYRERRARLFPTAAERRAEQVLDRALERRLARMPRA
jgi:predicted RNA-binding protein Jag